MAIIGGLGLLFYILLGFRKVYFLSNTGYVGINVDIQRHYFRFRDQGSGLMVQFLH